jgi:hypothetical protein
MFTLHVGKKEFFSAHAPTDRFGAYFEDDGETGYFYALEFGRKPNEIVDALHIYNVRNVRDSHKPSELQIVWSSDGNKCALLINNHPHAAFDFLARRGYCRTNFPNFAGERDWQHSDHSWSDDAISWLRQAPQSS